VTLLAPLFFYAALGVAAATVALHFIVTRQPTSSALPTVRFVPQGTVRVVTFSRPRDLLLLFLRVLLILLVGLAFARPILVPERRPVARIVLADISRRVADTEEVRDSALALLGPGDVLVVFDDVARAVRREAADSARHLARSPHDGRLSAALVAALRTAPELREEADSLELAVISAFRADQLDGATLPIRELWPGRIRLVPVAATPDSLPPSPGVEVRADADDGVAVAVRLAGLTAADPSVRLVRGTPTAADSAWAAAGPRTLVHWPAEGAPAGWRELPRPDTVGGVVAGVATVVYPFERRWTPAPTGEAEPGTAPVETTSSDYKARGPAAGPASTLARVTARWIDGEPAALERPLGDGCIRDVAIPVPTRGDLVLRPAFGHLVRALAAPCLATRASQGVDDEVLQRLAGSGPLASWVSVARTESVPTPLVPWLLAAALLLALAELLVRRGAARRDRQGEFGEVG